jgi:hypothetical protein
VSNLDRLREYLNDPIIESECGSIENFIQNVIDWSGSVERIAIAAREDQKNVTHGQSDKSDWYRIRP